MTLWRQLTLAEIFLLCKADEISGIFPFFLNEKTQSTRDVYQFLQKKDYAVDHAKF
jgi:hypothetical protein